MIDGFACKGLQHGNKAGPRRPRRSCRDEGEDGGKTPPRTASKPALAQADRRPLSAGLSTLLKQHTVSGAWQDFQSADGPGERCDMYCTLAGRLGNLAEKCFKNLQTCEYLGRSCVKPTGNVVLVQVRVDPRAPQPAVCVPARIPNALSAAHIPRSRSD